MNLILVATYLLGGLDYPWKMFRSLFPSPYNSLRTSDLLGITFEFFLSPAFDIDDPESGAVKM